MIKKITGIILIALILLNIIDGDFANPSVLDYIKLGIIVVALILNFIPKKKSKLA